MKKYFLLIIFIFQLIFFTTFSIAEKKHNLNQNFPIDLNKRDIYIRHGFSENWVNNLPIDDINWKKFPGEINGQRSLRANEININGIKKYPVLQFKKILPETYTFVTSFDLTTENINSTEPLGLYLEEIAFNYEIFINGKKIVSEIYLNKDGSIKIPRMKQKFLIGLNNKNLLVGKNILACKIIGNPLDNRTGLYFNKYYLIDHYSKLFNKKNYLIYYVISILYLFLGFYYLALFFRKKDEKFNLYFGLCCLCLPIYVSLNLIFDFIENIFCILISSDYPNKISFISISFFSIFLSYFVTSIFNFSKLNLKIIKFLILLQYFFIFSLIILPFYLINYFLMIRHIFMLIMIVIFFLLTIQKLIEKSKTEKNHNNNIIHILFNSLEGNFFIGISIFNFFCLIEIFATAILNINIYSGFLGFLIFTFVIILMLSNKFQRIYLQVEDLNKNLELKVIERTEELEQAQASKTKFFNHMSHELRSPLNSLLILAQDLVKNHEKNLTPDQIKSIQIILQSGNNLLNLINDILDFAKIEAKKMNLTLSKLSIKTIEKNFREEFQALMSEKGLNYLINVAENISNLEIKTDQKRLYQIIRNLISNSLKFTEAGTIELSLKKYGFRKIKNTTSKDCLLFEVKDTGIGIPYEKMQTIFNPFEQVKTQNSGTGLGLAIVQELVKMLNGEITVESNVDKGSTFKFFLPVDFFEIEELKTNQQFINISNYSEKKDFEIKMVCKGKKILVVDDDMRNTFALSKALNEYGFFVEITQNGKKAIEKINQQSDISIILMDVMMPEMDGIEATKSLRKNPNTANIPIIILSAVTDNEEQYKALQSGANLFLAKPIDLAILLENIIKFL